MYANIKALRRDAGRRLRRGEHMVLYGARGSGKSTLLVDLQTRLTEAGVACAMAATTHSLDDITRALEQAFPAANGLDVPPRVLKRADLQGGVLLLDHLTDVSNVMVRFLRKLRGGVIGVLTAVDTEVEQERPRMKPWRLGALSMRMPPLPAALLHELLQARCAELHVPLPGPDAEQQLLRAANGRPGWILQCVELQASGHYRQGEQIFVAELSDETENALRHLALGRRPSGNVSP
jgi:energy-coupling factor transporter ATP-binding protein EcfA2